MITIRELAKRAGVSVATVSRVLNNYPDVSEETRERVNALVKSLSYRPSAAARSLTTRRSNVLGVFFLQDHIHTMLLHPFFQEVIVGFKRTVGAAGFDLLFFTNQKPGVEDFTYTQRCQHHQVDGVVLMGVSRHDPGMLELAASGTPCMSIDVDIIGKRAGYVLSDNRGGAKTVVRHLLGLGHRRVALINGAMTTPVGHERFMGYREALDEAAIPFRADYMLEDDFTWEHGYGAMKTFLGLKDPPTAVFAGADLSAMGAIKAIREHGLRVPEDIAIAGFDDIQVATMVHPALTTVRQLKEDLGRTAGEALIQMIENPDATARIVTLPTELIVRESCGAYLRRD